MRSWRPPAQRVANLARDGDVIGQLIRLQHLDVSSYLFLQEVVAFTALSPSEQRVKARVGNNRPRVLIENFEDYQLICRSRYKPITNLQRPTAVIRLARPSTQNFKGLFCDRRDIWSTPRLKQHGFCSGLHEKFNAC